MDNYRSEYLPDMDSPPGDEKRGGLRRFLLDVVETLALSLILFLGINAISARIRVESISMQPTLYEGNFVLVNRVAYRVGEVGRRDVVIFRFPLNPDKEPYIKRVIGLPGDEIKVADGYVYINGVAMQETYIKSSPNYNGSWVVPEGNIFVLGDNRNNSSDSHNWGFVPVENIIGKAEFVYWPPENWQILNPSIAYAASP